MTLDKETRLAIAQAVEKNVREAMQMYNEVWLTGEDLCKQFGMISPDWLRRYGSTLPRERIEVTVVTPTGEETKSSRWGYPLHKIQRMIQNREHKQLILYTTNNNQQQAL